jgi:hypothetical protein
VLTVVVGPPAGGKSTWVLERARPTDVVIDFDRLAVALTGHGGDPHDHAPVVTAVTRAARKAAIETALRHTGETDVYLIHSSPGAQRIAQYQQMGADIVTIDPGQDVVRERCKTQRPRRMFAVIGEWYRERGPQTGATTSVPSRSAPRVASLNSSRDWFAA